MPLYWRFRDLYQKGTHASCFIFGDSPRRHVSNNTPQPSLFQTSMSRFWVVLGRSEDQVFEQAEV
jgi:hypothetical protein